MFGTSLGPAVTGQESRTAQLLESTGGCAAPLIVSEPFGSKQTCVFGGEYTKIDANARSVCLWECYCANPPISLASFVSDTIKSCFKAIVSQSPQSGGHQERLDPNGSLALGTKFKAAARQHFFCVGLSPPSLQKNINIHKIRARPGLPRIRCCTSALLRKTGIFVTSHRFGPAVASPESRATQQLETTGVCEAPLRVSEPFGSKRTCVFG